MIVHGPRWLGCLFLVAAGGLVGCENHRPVVALVCESGDQTTCPCEDGSEGIRDCADSGGRWEPCDCDSGAAGSAGVAGTADMPNGGAGTSAGAGGAGAR